MYWLNLQELVEHLFFDKLMSKHQVGFAMKAPVSAPSVDVFCGARGALTLKVTQNCSGLFQPTAGQFCTEMSIIHNNVDYERSNATAKIMPRDSISLGFSCTNMTQLNISTMPGLPHLACSGATYVMVEGGGAF